MRTLVCGECDSELEVVCPKGHDVSAVGTTDQRPRGTVASRSYKPKPCARCQRPFQPSGPRSRYCDRAECQGSPTPNE